MKVNSHISHKNFGRLINADLSDQEILNSIGIKDLYFSAWSIFIGKNGIFYSSSAQDIDKKDTFVTEIYINLDIMMEDDEEMRFLSELGIEKKFEKIMLDPKLSHSFLKKMVTFARNGINSYDFSNEGSKKVEEISYFLSKRDFSLEKKH